MMTVDTLIVVFAGGLFGLLMAVLAWIGNRVHTRLDVLNTMLDEKLSSVSITLTVIERDLRHELSDLDRRTTRIETEILHRRITDGD